MDDVKTITTRTSDELWIYYSGHGNAIFEYFNSIVTKHVYKDGCNITSYCVQIH